MVVDSMIWLSTGLLGFAAFGTYLRTLVRGTRGGFIAVGVALLFACLAWRREIVTFDAARQKAEWQRRRARSRWLVETISV